MGHSEHTITEAVRRWKANIFGAFQPSNVAVTGVLTTKGSKGQEFLEGCMYKWGENNWLSGHITLSPMSSGDGFCESAHLTVGGRNYFYEIDGHASPSGPPKQFAGKFSVDGSALPAGLRQDVEDILDKLLTF